jgi:hypothetical protein
MGIKRKVLRELTLRSVLVSTDRFCFMHAVGVCFASKLRNVLLVVFLYTSIMLTFAFLGVLLLKFVIFQDGPAKKTLKSVWFRWAMEHHNFEMIHLSDADLAGLSGAVKEFLFSEADIMASAGDYGEEQQRASKVKNILPSLKYFLPQVPKPNEKARPLTNDQKNQNAIFMRGARKLWKKAGTYDVGCCF